MVKYGWLENICIPIFMGVWAQHMRQEYGLLNKLSNNSKSSKIIDLNINPRITLSLKEIWMNIKGSKFEEVNFDPIVAYLNNKFPD